MIRNYFKIALRNILNNKVNSFINIIGLALGISVFFLIVEYVSFETSYESFYKNADRIYRVRNDRIYYNKHDKSAGCPPALAPTLKSEIPEIQESARLKGTEVTFVNTEKNISDIIDKAYYADPSFLKIFSFPLLEGSEHSVFEAPYSVIISQSLSRKYFGNQDAINKEITLTNEYGNHNYKITGVFQDIPLNSHIKFNVLISFETLVKQNKQAEYYWGWNAFNTYLLLSPKADQKALEVKLSELVEKYKNYESSYKRVYLLQPIKDIHLYSNLRFEPELNGSADTVKFLSVIAILVLILAWSNYINLSTSRSLLRAKEVGIRKVLGSNRIKLIKQFMGESFLMNLSAVILAILIDLIALPYFNQLTGLPLSVGLLENNLAILLGILITGAFLSGIYPAFIMSSFRPVVVLTNKIKSTLLGIDLRKGLVVFQFTVSIILISTTLIVYEQLSFMKSKSLGINIDQTLIMKAPMIKEDGFSKITHFKDVLNSVPNVISVSASSTIPGKGYSNASSGVRKYGSKRESGTQGFFIDVDENYFQLFNVPLVVGRYFNRESRYNGEIILNEEAVKEYGFKNPEDAVNNRLVFDGFDGQDIKIVGVTKNYHQESLKSKLLPVIFNPINASDINLTKYFSLKIDGKNVQQTLRQIKTKWDEVFPDQSFEYNFLDEVFNAQYKADQQFGKIFGLFTFLAIIISCLGLLGLAMHTNMQRTKEIGIRKVLGASVTEIVSMLSLDFSKLVLVSNIIAWPIAYYLMNRWLQDFAYKTEISWWIFILSGGITLAITLITVGGHSLRAALVNPVESLRYE